MVDAQQVDAAELGAASCHGTHLDDRTQRFRRALLPVRNRGEILGVYCLGCIVWAVLFGRTLAALTGFAYRLGLLTAWFCLPPWICLAPGFACRLGFQISA